MRILDICIKSFPPSRQSILWIACGSAATVGVLALALRSYGYKHEIEVPKYSDDDNDCIKSTYNYSDVGINEHDDNCTEGQGKFAHTEFLIEQLIMTSSTDDRLIVPLLITLCDRLAGNPGYFEDGRFANALSKLCNSNNPVIRKNALLVACNLCRLAEISRFPQLINVLFARLRFARYMLELDELTDILNCLCNLSLHAGNARFFLPSLEIIAEIVSFQGQSNIASARLAAWKTLVNLSHMPFLIIYLMNMPWQWMTLIRCDQECETRRILFLSNLLGHFPIYIDFMRKIYNGSLIAVLTSPITYAALKDKFKPSQNDSYHVKVSETFIKNLENAFTACNGPSRLVSMKTDSESFSKEYAYLKFGDFSDCFFKSSRLFPNPDLKENIRNKLHFPHHFDRNWSDEDIKIKAKQLCQWYNMFAVRCKSATTDDTIPYRMKFIEHKPPFCDENFIGELIFDWTVYAIFEKEDTSVNYFQESKDDDIITDFSAVHPLVLGEDLIYKDSYSANEADRVKERMNLIIDELALLCPSFYPDVMRFRELPYINTIMDHRPDNAFSSFSEHSHLLNTCAFPLPNNVVPHRPFIYEMNEPDDLSTDECADMFLRHFKRNVLPEHKKRRKPILSSFFSDERSPYQLIQEDKERPILYWVTDYIADKKKLANSFKRRQLDHNDNFCLNDDDNCRNFTNNNDGKDVHVSDTLNAPSRCFNTIHNSDVQSCVVNKKLTYTVKGYEEFESQGIAGKGNMEIRYDYSDQMEYEPVSESDTWINNESKLINDQCKRRDNNNKGDDHNDFSCTDITLGKHNRNSIDSRLHSLSKTSSFDKCDNNDCNEDKNDNIPEYIPKCSKKIIQQVIRDASNNLNEIADNDKQRQLPLLSTAYLKSSDSADSKHSDDDNDLIKRTDCRR